MYLLAHRAWGEDLTPFARYLHYCGITEVDVADDLLASIRSADIVGTMGHTERWKKCMRRIFTHYGIRPRRICSAWVTHKMIRTEEFYDLLRHRRVTVAGRRAAEAVPRLHEIPVAAALDLPLDGLPDVGRVLSDLNFTHEFDLALIAGGVPATVLCPHIARTTGRIAIDFGHALDLLIDGVQYYDCDAYFEDLVQRFNRNYGGR